MANLGAILLLGIGFVLLVASAGPALSVLGELTATSVLAALVLLALVLVAAILLTVANLLDSLKALPPAGRAERAREERVRDEFLRAEGDLALRSR